MGKLDKLTVRQIINIIRLIVIISIWILIDIHIRADYLLLLDFSRTTEWVWTLIKHITVFIATVFMIKSWKDYKKTS